MLLSLFFASLQSPSAPAGEVLWAELGFDRAEFLVAAPDAAESAATRLNRDLAAKSGFVPAPTAGFLLSGRVIAECADGDWLAALCDGLGARSCEPLAGLERFWLVDAGSVRAALALRETLAAALGGGAAYLDARRPWAQRWPTDPGFGLQWHLRNLANPLFDANVQGAWNMGYTGAGVTIGVIDGGIYVTHPDLAPNYEAAASQTGGTSNHGTSCAGVAAAVANNAQGGVGAAYDATWANLYYGFSSQNAAAFAHRNDLNDVKSNSWGPPDNGAFAQWTTVEAAALADAATNGRGGLGVAFTWAAGNGGTIDRVDYDPFASNRYTVAVGAITDGDVRSGYNETGSSMFCVAQSDGGSQGIYTTYGSNGYTLTFGGTSSACPLGAGIVALMLDANPALTWRDVQHILARSARLNHPGDPAWETNGAGKKINYNYGFGAVDATAAVGMALSWTNVSAELGDDSGVQAVNQAIPDNNAAGLVRTHSVAGSFRVESVELILNVDHAYIGDVQITLTSPDGTQSLLAKKRVDAQDDLVNYVFTTFRCWDEDAQGDWIIKLADLGNGAAGTWLDYRLMVHGNDGSGGPGASALSTGGVVAGQTATFQLSQGVPSTNAWLAASKAGLGSTWIGQLGVSLGIASPFLLAGPTMTDGAGAAAWNVAVPPGAAGASFWAQAAQFGKVSNVLAGVVQ